MHKDLYHIPEIAIRSDYEEREAYREGRFSREGELTLYPCPCPEEEQTEEDIRE